MTHGEVDPGRVEPARPLLEGAARGGVADQHVEAALPRSRAASAAQAGDEPRAAAPRRRPRPRAPRRARAASRESPAARLVTSETRRHPDAGVAGRDHLEDGGHAHQVGAQRRGACGSRPGSRSSGPARPGVDPLPQRDAEARGAGVEQPAQPRVVGLAHVGEARPEPLVVRPGERVRAGEVQVVGDADQRRPGASAGFTAPAALVRSSERTPNQARSRTPKVTSLGRGPLVEVDAPLQDGHRHAAQRAPPRAGRRGPGTVAAGNSGISS